MNKLSKSLLSVGLISASLFACSKEKDSPTVESKTEELTTFNLSAEIDPVYEYDDNEARAAKFTAEDAPRIVLTQEEVSKGPSSANSLEGANTLEPTTVRVNWFAVDTSLPNPVTEMVDGANLFHNQVISHQKQEIVLSEKNGNYRLDMKIKVPNLLNDRGRIKKAKYRNSKYTFYGNVFLGGWPGAPNDGSLSLSDERGHQFYSRVFSGKIGGKIHTNMAPNHRIDELDGSATSMARRHFPLVGKLIKLRVWNNVNDPDGADNAYTSGETGNTGQIVSRDGLYMQPRGTIFTLTLQNETGQEITVNSIEVPHSRGTRGQAFSFEGRFVGSGLNPEQNLTPIYRRFDGNGNSTSYAAPDVVAMYDVDTFKFPVYGKNGSAGITLAPSATSGRLMVWAYAHNPEQMKPFTVRVRYTVGGQEVESKYQTITPPEGGFKEGKAYRAVLKVKTL